MVRKLNPEYVSAAPKKIAWVLGFILAIIMFFLVIIYNTTGPINLFVCLICLILLFFEVSFGICLWCKLFNIFNKKKAKLCPGGACTRHKKEAIQKINIIQVISVLSFIALIILIKFSNILEQKLYPLNTIENTQENIEIKSSDNCEVPEWAIKIGHEEQYKLHHGCE